MAKPKVRAAIYTRMSVDKAGRALGIARQKKACRERADQLGWTVIADDYEDNDVSATRTKVRPQYQRLLADIDAGKIDAVVVYAIDRLTRQPREFEDILDRIQSGQIYFSSISDPYDFTDDTGRMAAGIMAQIARHESKKIARRQKAKQQQLREAGLPFGGGKRPFGYMPDRRTVIETEATVIREMADRVLAGESTGSIARDLNARGVPTVSQWMASQPPPPGRQPTTVKPSQWSRTTVRSVLTKPRLWGVLTYKGEQLSMGDWPAILDISTGERLLAAFASPERKRLARTNRRKHLLSGIATCGVCGTPLAIRHPSASSGFTELAYKCPARACVMINQRYLDEYVYSRAARTVRLTDSKRTARVDVAAIVKRIEEIQGRVDELAARYIAGEVSAVLADKVEREGAREIEALRKQLEDAYGVEEVDLPTDLVIENPGDLTLEDRRRIVQRAVKSLVINRATRKGRGFDVDRVALELTGREVVTDDDVDSDIGDPWTTVRRRPVDEKPVRAIKRVKVAAPNR